jgi:hypothetical protein
MLRLAARDLMASPLKTTLTALVLLSLTATAGVVLVLGEFLMSAVDVAMLEQPAVVIRREDEQPLDIDGSLRRVKEIPGVLAAWPRIHENNRPLKAGMCDDVALHVFYTDEIDAMLPELRDAFPWPVTILTRERRDTTVTGRIAHRTALWIFLFIPALLALVYLVIATRQSTATDRYEIGVQKAFGWCSRDIVRRHLYRAVLLGIPAVAAGGILAFVIALTADHPSVSAFLLGPAEPPIVPLPEAGGVLRSILVLMAVVLIPYFIASLIPATTGVLADPGELIQRSEK